MLTNVDAIQLFIKGRGHYILYIRSIKSSKQKVKLVLCNVKINS
jgi:hypothetical protein